MIGSLEVLRMKGGRRTLQNDAAVFRPASDVVSRLSFWLEASTCGSHDRSGKSSALTKHHIRGPIKVQCDSNNLKMRSSYQQLSGPISRHVPSFSNHLKIFEVMRVDQTFFEDRSGAMH